MNSGAQPLQIIPLGVGDYFSKRHYTTTFLVLGGRTRMMIDCADPFFKSFHEAAQGAGIAVEPLDIDAVLLTHLHGDHCNGLEGLGYFRRMAPNARGPLPVYLLPEALADLWERKLRASMGRSHMPHQGIDSTSRLEDFFSPHTVLPGSPFMIGDLQVEIRRTRHPVPCFGCKIHYGGRTLGYSGDTDFDPDHIEFLTGSDLIFHECSEGIHAHYAQLAGLPESLRRKMRLVHLADSFDRAASTIEPAEAGKTYRV